MRFGLVQFSHAKLHIEPNCVVWKIQNPNQTNDHQFFYDYRFFGLIFGFTLGLIRF